MIGQARLDARVNRKHRVTLLVRSPCV
jgi:hypothetical protein